MPKKLCNIYTKLKRLKYYFNNELERCVSKYTVIYASHLRLTIWPTSLQSISVYINVLGSKGSVPCLVSTSLCYSTYNVRRVVKFLMDIKILMNYKITLSYHKKWKHSITKLII